ncbi:MAG: HepT-like ribonuclease domain-containing protein [Thermomicrobiales bacterium]
MTILGSRSLHRSAVDALLDLLDFCAEIEEFSQDRDTGDESLERMRYLAIERLFELLGESMKRALSADPTLEQQLPYARQIISMRNRLAHEYDNIDLDTIWDAADNHVPLLSRQVSEHLVELGIIAAP